MATLAERVAQLQARLPEAGEPVAASTVIAVFIEVARHPLPLEDDPGWLMLDLVVRPRSESQSDSLVLSLGHDFHGSDSADDLHALTVEGTVLDFDGFGPDQSAVRIYGDGGRLLDKWEAAVQGHPVIRDLMQSPAVFSGWHIHANTDD